MLVKEIGKADESESATERFSDKLLTILSDLPCLDLTRPEHQAIQLQVCVINHKLLHVFIGHQATLYSTNGA